MAGDLGEFLRARRALIGPAAAGLVAGGRRHVRGLRREELALLAGISVDYYVRLEQGRDRNPSPEVVDALARALQLDDDAATHLRRLAAVTVAAPVNDDEVRPSVARLVDTSPWPVALLDRTLSVLRANELAVLLNPGLAEGRNLVRDAFLDPSVAALHVDAAAVRAECVAALRSAAGIYPDDAELQRLVGELSVHSRDFRSLWARADVNYCRTGKKVLNHPAVGRLCLDYETLDVGDASGQRLLIHSAEPGRPDGDKLALIRPDLP
ncbi:helix-turn-helix domain-containing protein [Actinoplanes sp. LDG1-06]|uniref:Helix-turn-helix domain-containing protein n=1 Tax=Paractinoplanes ovalisporus TaxID=2810368 RepID=A0ABS2A6Y0_9ACTN|nr:helix-turn-helix domain-containing protein [Actinoplanes ovalisporus]MBM2615592.1 helix-turn-helix domain-containing protein [Actinoplanes ovalisporus]